eukprot:gb/GECG01001575.1/.p1 GENE.gb/GECG01001575.1/~~gb/GECG01001575.1/.p1  ORF type:complete len:105 (+),score=17.69 gb/GECG01001575.1/:1-315(+)
MHADNGNTELSIWIVPSIVRREREGLTGIARKEEVVHQTMGEDVDIFDRDATAFEEEGTKDNPIVILSNERSRIVGISLPVSFSLKALAALQLGDQRPLQLFAG